MGHDGSPTIISYRLRIFSKKRNWSCLASLFFPYRVAPRAQLTLSPLGHQRNCAPPLPPRCFDPALRHPPCPSFLPCALDRRLLKLGVGAEDRRQPFLRDLSVASLNSMWAPSSPLIARAAVSGELHMPTSFHSPKQQGDVVLKVHVASVCFKCFRCFIWMLQVFYLDVAKVDRDVAHVAYIASFS